MSSAIDYSNVNRLRSWLAAERDRRWEEDRIKNLIPDLQRDLKHGWLLSHIQPYDVWSRWQYWAECQYSMLSRGTLPDRPIPQIEFHSGHGSSAEGLDSDTGRHLQRCLDLIPNQGRGGWQGWSSWGYINYFLDWLLYAFGYGGQKTLPEEPKDCPGASMRLYQFFNLGKFMAYPFDYFGGLLADMQIGRRHGFFPTPHCVVHLMAHMTYGVDPIEDTRLAKVYEPCVGTGRMLLYASNYSLMMYGNDISEIMVKCTLINLAMYAPWGYYPIFSIESYRDYQKQTVEEFDSPPAVVSRLMEDDPENELKESWKFAPVETRKRKENEPEVLQGSFLF